MQEYHKFTAIDVLQIELQILESLMTWKLGVPLYTSPECFLQNLSSVHMLCMFTFVLIELECHFEGAEELKESPYLRKIYINES